MYIYSHLGTDNFDLTGDNADPKGITTRGNLFYISDEDDNRVYVYTEDGTYLGDQ